MRNEIKYAFSTTDSEMFRILLSMKPKAYEEEQINIVMLLHCCNVILLVICHIFAFYLYYVPSQNSQSSGLKIAATYQCSLYLNLTSLKNYSKTKPDSFRFQYHYSFLSIRFQTPKLLGQHYTRS